MDIDAAVRWGALTLLPIAGVTAYFVSQAQPVDVASPPAPSAATPVVVASGQGRRPSAEVARTPASAHADPPAERAAPPPAPPPAAVEPPPSMAVDLAVADSMGELGATDELAAGSGGPAPSLRDVEAPGPCGGVHVRLITASDDPTWSFASIADGPGQDARIRRVGDPVASWRVDSIEWDRVWLQGSGTKCAATIHDGAREARAAAGFAGRETGPLAAADDAPPLWQVPPDVADGIRQRSATEFVIDEAAVKEIFARGPELLAGVKLEPVKDGDQVVGVSLDSIPIHSLLDRLGLERGDVVLALNDSRVVTLDSAIAALGVARNRAALVARLKRGAEDFDVDVAVQKPE